MSCGNPHEVDCREVLARVSLFLDHSLAEHGGLDYEAFEQHLRECQPCVDQVGGQVEQLQNVLRVVLARCCGNEHAPDELRVRIMQRIRISQV